MSEIKGESLAPAGLATLAVAGAVTGAALLANQSIKNAPNTASSLSATSAARFLTQCTFGPTDSTISDVQSSGYATWLANQISMPISGSHLQFVQNLLTTTKPSRLTRPTLFYGSFWDQAVNGPDQLRQRVKMALSEIFVISFQNSEDDFFLTGTASYYDMLGQNAFGNFLTLMQQVTLHPMMGEYLTYLGNLPANPVTNSHPDENYAREIMQLMTIGLYQLNQDGTLQLDGSGNPIPTYSHADIAGLAAVFTGFSWWSANPINTGKGQTFYPTGMMGRTHDTKAPYTPMIAYPMFHQTTSKTFLTYTPLGQSAPQTGFVAATTTATTASAMSELNYALTWLFNHPNVGPFVGKQLIQRLVTSNPSPAYVGRVAAVFNNDGTGVRGNLAAVVTAILLDDEARAGDTTPPGPTFGKLREPVMRLANWARSFYTTSTSGQWIVPSTTAPESLDQTVLTAPSVFNFFAPGYIPPGTSIEAAGLVAPEFQAVNSISVAGYLNTMLKVITSGLGTPYPAGHSPPDVQTTYADEVSLAANPANLVARLNLLLMYGTMTPQLQTQIINAVTAIATPTAPPAAVTAALTQRVQLAVFLTFASIEYLVQR